LNRNTLPTTTTPGAIVAPSGRILIPGAVDGYTKRGTPIPIIAGGSGEGGEGGTGTGGTGGNAGGAGGEGGTGQGGQDPAGGGGGPKLDGPFDQARAERLIANLRADLDKAKGKTTEIETRSKAQLDQIAKALGLKSDADPVELQKQLDTRASEARQARLELAVYRAAKTAGADADALLDSRAFLAAMADVDLAAADADSKIDAAVKAAVKANGKLAAAPAAPGKSGAEITGGTGTGEKITEEQLAKMTPQQITEALQAGKLAHLL
jgi:hypothetical protein